MTEPGKPLQQVGTSADGVPIFVLPQVLQQMRDDGITAEGMSAAFEQAYYDDPSLVAGLKRGDMLGVVKRITPRAVLDLQGDLAERLEHHPDGTRSSLAQYLDAVAQADLGAIGVGAHGGEPDVTVSRVIFEHVLTSRAIRVGGSMTEEVMLRTHDTGILGRDKIFGEDIAPIRHRGFAVFEEPLWISEVRSRRQVVHAMSWGFLSFAGSDGQTGRGWLVTFWGDLSRDVDEVIEPLLMDEYGPNAYIKMFGRWAPVMCFPIVKGHPVGDPCVPLSETRLADIAEHGQTPNHESQRPERIMAALWQLLGETIATDATVVPETPSTPRSVGRSRKSVRPEVTVCVLRRPSRPTMHPGTGKKRETRSWVEGGYEITYWTGPGRSIPVKRVIAGHWSVSDEELPIRNRPHVDDLRR